MTGASRALRLLGADIENRFLASSLWNTTYLYHIFTVIFIAPLHFDFYGNGKNELRCEILRSPMRHAMGRSAGLL